MTKPKPKDQLQKRGRKSDFRPEYILIAKACARFGAIEDEIANELNIGPATLDRWKQKYPEFRCALKAGKEASDDRVERSLYQLAIGWNGQPPNATAAREVILNCAATRHLQEGERVTYDNRHGDCASRHSRFPNRLTGI
jgi:hypothetical protein